MSKETARASGVDAGWRRTRRAKAGVVVASAAMFVVAVPAVQGTEHGHARPAHALAPPRAFVQAVTQVGFGAGELAPSQDAPVVQSSGS